MKHFQIDQFVAHEGGEVIQIFFATRRQFANGQVMNFNAPADDSIRIFVRDGNQELVPASRKA